ncbi:MAG: ATP-binding cassette domain-containing protein [Oscillospiraceae bacterium]|nr:ATP-binding cassette domain-containing protein [Oscillospiraceae bacterium]
MILTAEDIAVSFGSNHVLKSVSFELGAGEVLGVIGPNGAGKTVLLNVISGIQKADKGKLVFKGQDLLKQSVVQRARNGFGRTFQIPRSFSQMTVFENCLVGAVFGRDMTERASKQKVREVLELIGLEQKKYEFAGKLGLLERKRLEIGMALTSDPKVLLLDEVAGGLTESEVTEVLEIVRRIKSSGIGIMWIEHVLQTMLSGTDRVMLLAEGTNVISGLPEEVMASPEVERVYLGSADNILKRKRKKFGAGPEKGDCENRE